MKKCPYCAESIQPEATKCRYCGEFLTEGRTIATASGWKLRQAGIVLACLGVIGASYCWSFFDTSVQVPVQEIGGQTFGGQRVNNLGLMNDKQNALIFCGFAILAGVVLIAVGKPRPTVPSGGSGRAAAVAGGKVCPRCQLVSPESALKCDCGLRFT